MNSDQHQKAQRFRALHDREAAFVIPNPWDVGSARILCGLGFEALATTSSGLALALGRSDGDITRDEHMAHIRALCGAVTCPISADLENGYADHPEKAAQTIRLSAEAGAVGGSIEDYSGHGEARIYDFDHAVERIAAAVAVARSLPNPFTLTARAENLIRGRQDLDDTIRRLQAFEAVGADVLYAPGLKTADEVRQVCSALSRPVNVLAVAGMNVAELAEAGARRISLGGALARTALGGFLIAARDIMKTGSFSAFEAAPGFAEADAIMGRDGHE